MPKKQILRIRKLHTAREIRNSHALRANREPSQQPQWTRPGGEIIRPAVLRETPETIMNTHRNMLEAFGNPKVTCRSVLAVEVVAGISTELLLNRKPAVTQQLDRELVEEMAVRIYRFAEDEWPGRLLAFEVHLDEHAPHVHMLVVPITPDHRLSARDVFNRPALFHYHAEMRRRFRDMGVDQEAPEVNLKRGTSFRQFHKIAGEKPVDFPIPDYPPIGATPEEQYLWAEDANARQAPAILELTYLAVRSERLERQDRGRCRSDDPEEEEDLTLQRITEQHLVDLLKRMRRLKWILRRGVDAFYVDNLVTGSIAEALKQFEELNLTMGDRDLEDLVMDAIAQTLDACGINAVDNRWYPPVPEPKLKPGPKSRTPTP